MTTNKIISFSLWGREQKYLRGALENIELQWKYYPEWRCRFYVDSSVPENIIEQLNEHAEIARMPDGVGNFGLFWRFLPLDDPTVDRFIVRDADSRLSAREAQAVLEWEASGSWFHLMRDHPGHIGTPICGGMWGATKQFRPGYMALLNNWLAGDRSFGHERGEYFYTDQTFLEDCIWPLVKDNHIAHESIQTSYPGYKRDFITANPDGSFIGMQVR